MPYAVHEIFYSIQGEGAMTGRPAVFCRFAGCNLWSGREEDRGAAQCSFCDTLFVGGDSYEPKQLADAMWRLWPGGAKPFAVLTGGEPMLQVDSPLIDALKRAGFFIAIETNGTIPIHPGIDWVCVSPKVLSRTVVKCGDELKLVYPQAGIRPCECGGWGFTHHWLQPMDGPALDANTKAAIDYCMKVPRWKLSVQTQKLVGLR